MVDSVEAERSRVNRLIRATGSPGLLAGVFVVLGIVFFPFFGHATSVVVDFSQTQGLFTNIAGGINFWGQEAGQRRFVDQVGTDLYRLKIRLHRVEKTKEGYTRFPWQGDDLTVDDLKVLVRNMNLAKVGGCRIMIQIYGIPKWLSTSNDERTMSNNLPNYAKYPPKDYVEWTRVVFETIKELKKLGLKAVDYYEIFGEPNVGSTWYGQRMPCKKRGRLVHGCEENELGHNGVQVMNQFFKVYQSTVNAIKTADPKAKIGGPAIIPNPSGIWWTKFFAEYVKSNGLPLDFYSWHWYGADEALSSMLAKIGSRQLTAGLVRRHFEDRLEKQGFSQLETNGILVDVYDYFKDLQALKKNALRYPYSFVSSHLERILTQEGLGETALILTEWNVNHAADIRHDTHYGASFITKGLIDITDSRTQAQNFYVLSNRKQEHFDRGFGGLYGLFKSDKENTPKASFNAFKLFSMLGNRVKRVKVEIAGDDIYAIATKSDDHDRVALLVTYYVMARVPDYSLGKDVTITIRNLPFSSFVYILYMIDRAHSNSYYESGPELQIAEQGNAKGDLEKVLEFPVYGVMMLEVKRS